MAFVFAILLIILAIPSTPYKILVYNPKFAHSHSSFLGRVADVLADAGHNVTSLIPIMDNSVGDGTGKSHIIYVQADPHVASDYSNPRKVNFFEMKLFNPNLPYFIGQRLGNIFSRTCKRVVNEPGLIDKLREENYDVYITENFEVCGARLAAAIEPKTVIGATSTCLWGWQSDEFGVDRAISHRPTLITSSFYVRSTISRFWNAVGEAINLFTFSYVRIEVNRVLKERFGAEYPTTWQQSANVAFVLTNSEPLIESAAPTSTRVINIPGIGSKVPQPLDSFWTEVVDRREKTVLLSFGSVAKSTVLSEASKSGILQALAQFPEVTFIWKYEDPRDSFSTNHTSKLGNVVISKWIPQVDLLGHAKTVAFITHGGMASVQEAAQHGVPGIYVPIFGDQPRNAGMMQFNGLGIVYDKFELHDGEKLGEAIKEVLENPKYTENAIRISRMLARKPFTSNHLLIKYVEFAAEFGASSALRPRSVDMTFVEYHNLDITALFGLVTILQTMIVFRLARRLISFISIRKQKLD